MKSYLQKSTAQILVAIILIGCNFPGASAVPNPVSAEEPEEDQQPDAEEDSSNLEPGERADEEDSSDPEPTQQPTEESTPTPADDPQGEVLYNSNMRTGPGEDFDIIKVVEDGEIVLAHQRNTAGDWIIITDAEGDNGWLFAELVDLPTGVIADLPVSANAEAYRAVQEEPPLQPEPITGEVVTGANLRNGPGLNFNTVGGLQTGTQVTVLGSDESGEWLFIQTSGGANVWIASFLIRLPERISIEDLNVEDTDAEPVSVAESAPPPAAATEPAPPPDVPTPIPPTFPPAPQPASGNLLVNGGFEGPYYRVSTAEGGGAIAPGWKPWWYNDAGNDFQVPEYEIAPISRDPVRVRSGGAAQQMFRPFIRWRAGLYQQVDIPAGSNLQFSVYGHSWSTFCVDRGDGSADCDTYNSNRENTGNKLWMKVGIDPNGGTDPFSPNIVWSQPKSQWDAFGLFSVTARANTGTVTVFLYGEPEFPARINNAYWDDAELVLLQ